MKDRAFCPVFVFRKGRLSFKTLFVKLILPSGANSKTYGQLPLINLNTTKITYCLNLVLSDNQFKSLILHEKLWTFHRIEDKSEYICLA